MRKFQDFLSTLWMNWASLMSGAFSVPFAIVGTFAPEGHSRLIFFGLAYLSLAVCAYSLWNSEYDKVKRHEELARPKIVCAFDPDDAGCVRRDTTINFPLVGPINATYFRLRVSTSNMTSVNGCRATLTRISRGSTVIMQGENVPLPFAHRPPDGIQVNDQIPDYVDLIAITADNQVFIAAFGLIVPNSIQPDQLFIVRERYTFRVVVSCDDGPPVVIEPVLDWTGERATSTILSTEESMTA